MTTQDLHRTALITGASRGLGLALSRALAVSNWNLIITARDPKRLHAVRDELADRTHVAMLAGDINDPGHRAGLAVLARGHAGLDAVVNNAGVLGPSPQPSLLEYPLDVLAEVYQTNVIAPLALLQAVQPELKRNARIVNITSDAALNAYAGWGGYGSSKAALEQLSAVLAVENPRLRIYWVDPGDMRSDMHQAAYPGEDISDRPLPETRVPGILALLGSDLPSGRYISSEIGVDVDLATAASTMR
jgi:NAD(P)-dependent dehydrogenase (short-subunit alcohol dehydrogenase family)